jgi:hypothetical protein
MGLRFFLRSDEFVRDALCLLCDSARQERSPACQRDTSHLSVPGRRKLGIAGISPFVNWNGIFPPYGVTRVGIDGSRGNRRSPWRRRKTAVFSGWHEPCAWRQSSTSRPGEFHPGPLTEPLSGNVGRSHRTRTLVSGEGADGRFQRLAAVEVGSEAAYESLQQDRRLLRILQAAGVHK